MPVPAVAIKADYEFYGDQRAAGEVPLDNNKFQVTVGFVFQAQSCRSLADMAKGVQRQG